MNTLKLFLNAPFALSMIVTSADARELVDNCHRVKVEYPDPEDLAEWNYWNGLHLASIEPHERALKVNSSAEAAMKLREEAKLNAIRALSDFESINRESLNSTDALEAKIAIVKIEIQKTLSEEQLVSKLNDLALGDYFSGMEVYLRSVNLLEPTEAADECPSFAESEELCTLTRRLLTEFRAEAERIDEMGGDIVSTRANAISSLYNICRNNDVIGLDELLGRISFQVAKKYDALDKLNEALALNMALTQRRSALQTDIRIKNTDFEVAAQHHSNSRKVLLEARRVRMESGAVLRNVWVKTLTRYETRCDY